MHAQINQNYGCINLGTHELELIVKEHLPFNPITYDPPIICPFFTRVDALMGLAGPTPVSYSALAQPQELEVGKQISQDIANASFSGQSPQLDRVFIFKWDKANISGEANKVLKVLAASALCNYSMNYDSIICELFLYA